MQYLLRRQVILVFITFCALPFGAFAQLFENQNSLDHDQKSFHFGINVGINRSHYNFTQHPRFLQYDSVLVVESINSTGLNLAWLVNKRISDHFDPVSYTHLDVYKRQV